MSLSLAPHTQGTGHWAKGPHSPPPRPTLVSTVKRPASIPTFPRLASDPAWYSGHSSNGLSHEFASLRPVYLSKTCSSRSLQDSLELLGIWSLLPLLLRPRPRSSSSLLLSPSPSPLPPARSSRRCPLLDTTHGEPDPPTPSHSDATMKASIPKRLLTLRDKKDGHRRSKSSEEHKVRSVSTRTHRPATTRRANSPATLPT